MRVRCCAKALVYGRRHSRLVRTAPDQASRCLCWHALMAHPLHLGSFLQWKKAKKKAPLTKSPQRALVTQRKSGSSWDHWFKSTSTSLKTVAQMAVLWKQRTIRGGTKMCADYSSQQHIRPRTEKRLHKLWEKLNNRWKKKKKRTRKERGTLARHVCKPIFHVLKKLKIHYYALLYENGTCIRRRGWNNVHKK